MKLKMKTMHLDLESKNRNIKLEFENVFMIRETTMDNRNFKLSNVFLLGLAPITI